MLASFKYSKLFGLREFYERSLKLVMYGVGNLQQQGRLDDATEHATTNTAMNPIKIINERIIAKSRSNETKSEFKAMICTPSGELHELACHMIELNHFS